MGKIAKAVGILFLALPLLGMVSFLAAPVRNDMALREYRAQQLKGLELPEDTELQEAVSGCGNSSGTGNHTELYVAALVRTGLAEKEFLGFFPEAVSVEEEGASTFAMELLGLSFSSVEDGRGLYIIEFEEEAPWSEFDLRGH